MLPLASPVVFLPLTQGKVSVIDFADLEKVGRVKWCAHRDGHVFYAVRKCGGRMKSLHREILKVSGRVDHKDGDGLNNTSANLRTCTAKQNRMNQHSVIGRSSFKGVHLHRGKWTARIQIDGKRKHLGYFPSEQEAAVAYDIAAKHRFGEFAKLNFNP